jgi:hypothetical protein
MKFFAFIMAFLVLALSIMPCADTNAMPNAKEKTEIAKSSQQQHDNHRDECSPFCTCTCCVGIALLGNFKKATGIIPPSAQVYSSMIASALFTIPLPIWQPPQLV